MEVPETERYRHILKPQRSKQPHWGQIKVWTGACHGQAGCSGPRSGHVGNTEQDRARAVDSHAYLASVCPTTAYDTDTSLCTGATGSGPMPCTPVISLCTLSAAALPLVCATRGHRYPAMLPLLSDMVNSSSPNPYRTRCPKIWLRLVLAGPLLSSTLLAAFTLAIHPHLLGRADRHQDCFLRGQHLTNPRQARGVQSLKTRVFVSREHLHDQGVLFSPQISIPTGQTRHAPTDLP